MCVCVNRSSSAVDSMSDYGDQGSNETKSDAASPLTAELNNGGLHPSASPTVATARHHPSSALSATQTAGVDRGHTPQFTGTTPLMYAGGQHQLHGLGSLVDAGLGCPSLTAGNGLDDDGGFLAMNVAAAAAAAAAAAGTFNIGYNRL